MYRVANAWRLLDGRWDTKETLLALKISFDCQDCEVEVHREHPAGRSHSLIEAILDCNQSIWKGMPDLQKSIDLVQNQIFETEIGLLERSNIRKKMCFDRGLERILNVIKKDSQESISALESGFISHQDQALSSRKSSCLSKKPPARRGSREDSGSDDDLPAPLRKRPRVVNDSSEKVLDKLTPLPARRPADGIEGLNESTILRLQKFRTEQKKFWLTPPDASENNPQSEDDSCCICVCTPR